MPSISTRDINEGLTERNGRLMNVWIDENLNLSMCKRPINLTSSKFHEAKTFGFILICQMSHFTVETCP